MGWLRGRFEGWSSGRGRRRWRVGLAVLAVGVGGLGLSACVADPPPVLGTAAPTDAGAVVSWQPPLAFPAPIRAYEVTPWVGRVAQTPIQFDSATTQTVTGLTNGTTYTFTVVAVNALGNKSASSDTSNPVTPGPQVAAGDDHTCALVAGGAVKCWGGNGAGQLGNGTFGPAEPVPVPVSGITDATAVSATYQYSCARLAGGTVKCWGSNAFGELGNGTVTSAEPIPVLVSGITDATAVSAGDGHTCARLTGGTVKCWGRNAFGELGNGTTTNSSTPVAVTGIANAIAVSAGNAHTCAWPASGAVNCWGAGANGELGDGTNTDSSIRTTVSGITDATAVDAGAEHTCARRTGGTLKCWGLNNAGQLGNGTTTNSSTPVAVTGIFLGATAVSAGAEHTCARLAGGTLKCWGNNGHGQLGNGTTTNSSTPVAVTGITSATAVSAGTGHTCAAVLARVAVACWGHNDAGQLGDGTTSDSSTPVFVVGL